MVAARRIIASSVDADQRRALVEISRSRTEPANWVECARIILDPAVSRQRPGRFRRDPPLPQAKRVGCVSGVRPTAKWP
jgi:hypothetical protein